MVKESKLHRSVYAVIKSNWGMLLLVLIPMVVFIAVTWQPAQGDITPTDHSPVADKKPWYGNLWGSESNCGFNENWPACRWKE